MPVNVREHGSANFVYEKQGPGGGPLYVLVHAYEGDASTTAALSLIAWNRAYALFPRRTFVEKVALILQDPLPGVRDYEV